MSVKPPGVMAPHSRTQKFEQHSHFSVIRHDS